MLTSKDRLDANRYNNSAAGRLVRKLISEGLILISDLENEDIRDLINQAEPWRIEDLQRGDEVFFLDITNPTETLIRGKVIYTGEFTTLGYNDKTLVTETGVRLSARRSFPNKRIEALIQRLLPFQKDIVFVSSSERLFRVINEETVEANTPRFVLES